jgi:Ni/Fe-hydrogenase b-type cytochrome subunit
MTNPPSKPQTRAQRGFSLAHKIPPPSGDYHWVYLWEWPIRAMHWIAVVCIIGLVVTGLYIGMPYLVVGGDTADHFLMGRMRFVHFSAAAFLVTKFERLPALFPVRPRDWVNMWRQVKFYLMIQPEKAPHYLGHNPLQQLSYTGVYLAALLMVVTGFAMYGQSNPAGIFYQAFNWVGILFGGMPVVRFIHHVLTWVFLIFLPIHLYLAVRADHLERTGVISSIISGGRFVPADEKYIDGDDI